MAFLLKKVVQEIEERVSTQAESFRKVKGTKKLFPWGMILFTSSECSLLRMCLQQNNFCKVLEEKYQSKIRVLETLTSGTSEENEVF